MQAVRRTIYAIILLLLGGCTNMSPSEQSTLSGSAIGALGGAALGSLSGHAGPGALIGASLGAVTGAIAEDNRQADARAYAQAQVEVEEIAMGRAQRSRYRESKPSERVIEYDCYDDGYCYERR